MSGLCYVHPHLGEYCKVRAIHQASIDLLDPSASEIAKDWPRPLQLASTALGQTFRELLIKEHIDDAYIESAGVTFDFYRGRWPSACLVRLDLSDGKHVEMAVGWDGRRAEVVSPS